MGGCEKTDLLHGFEKVNISENSRPSYENAELEIDTLEQAIDLHKAY